MPAPTQPSRSSAPLAVARVDATFPWYVGAALLVAVAGGFALALLLPLAAALQWDWGSRWRPLAQAHGHLQIIGWLGLFITGMGFRLVPRFAGRPLRFPRVTTPTLILLLAGVLGRALAQPWLDLPGMRIDLTASAAAELIGALLFAAAIIATVLGVVRSLPSAPLLILGALGMVGQALMGLLWLPLLSADFAVLPPDRDAALLTIEFFAFVLPFVLGISLRALPTFFAQPAPSGALTSILALTLALGATLAAAGPLLPGVAAGARVQAIGSLLVAAAVSVVIARCGVWREPVRLRAAARHLVLLIRTAYAWLALSVLALVGTALQALANGTPTPAAQSDAIRHMLALGVFSTLLVGMAFLLLPWLAMRRQRPGAARREVWLLWTLLTGATGLRVSGALLEEQGAGSERYWPMALGGVLAISAITLFALIILRAAHHETPAIVLHERREV